MDQKFKQEVGHTYCKWYNRGVYSDAEFVRLMSEFDFTPTDSEDLIEPYGSFTNILGWGMDNGYIPEYLYDRVLDALEVKEIRKNRVWATPAYEGYTHYNLGGMSAEKRRERLSAIMVLLGLRNA